MKTEFLPFALLLAMAFVNTDGCVAVLLANQTEEPKSVSIVLGERTSTVSLPAKSLNTIVIASK